MKLPKQMRQWATPLRQAIKRFDLESYLQAQGAQHIANDEYVLSCPTCGKQKLTVNASKKLWHCWVCESVTNTGAGNLVSLMALLEGTSKKAAIAKLLSRFVPVGKLEEIDGDLFEDEPVKPHVTIDIPPPPFGVPIDSTGILPYCVERGITAADAKAFGLFWCSEGRYANRLVFPVWESGKLVYWQARAMWKPAPGERFVKALNPPKGSTADNSGSVLFNLDQAAQYPRVAIAEGPIDAIHIGYDSVCTFGKKISPMQIRKLLDAGVTSIDLMWDGPSETEPQGAWPEMARIAPLLRALFADVRLVFLPQGDPGDYTREQLTALRQQAVSISKQSKIMEI